MKLNVITPLRQLDGKEIDQFDIPRFIKRLLDAGVQENTINEAAEGAKSPVTMRFAAVEALMADEQGMSGTDKLKRFRLAQKLHAGDEAELSAEETTLLQKAAEKRWPALIYGQIYDLTEGA